MSNMKYKKDFRDLLGQPLRVNQRFVQGEMNGSDEMKGREGYITEITDKYFRLVFDKGTASKRGRKMYYNTDFVVNIDAIYDKYPELQL